MGLSNRFWNILYLKTLTNLAEYIQELPASEAHHHSGRGGLLAHTMETALNALRIRRGKLLPPNSDAETVTRFKDVWTYAVFTAALGHDLGKPITDMSIELFDKKNSKLCSWSPFKGPMSTYQDAHAYKIQYLRNRVYASHERASALYIHHIFPVVGLEWIANNPEVFYYWTNLLTGHAEDSGVIGAIIHEADKHSVASNLAGDQISFNAVTNTSRKPLHQRILTSLRYQIDEGMLPLNRDGAAGWIVDSKLWIVVKRALDQVRDHMTLEGQTGIPARNDRIMDELQQYNILIPNGDKAVWKCQVFAPDWPKAHELTLLCLSTDKVWPSDEAKPESFNGSVKALNPSISADSDTPMESTLLNEPINQEQQTGSHSGESDYPETDETPINILPTRQILVPPTINFSELAAPSPILDSKLTSSTPNTEDHNKTQGTVISPEFSASTADLEPETNGGTEFLNWLRDGLHHRQFKVNDVNSRIHMTKEGLLLLSPAIFKQFDQQKWSYVQKRFTKLKLHERNSNGTNIHEYLASGAKKRSIIKGFLITDTANVFPGIELPTINHALSKVVI